MTDATINSDQARNPIVAQRHTGGAGGVAIRGHFNGVLVLSGSEIDRLVAFARSENESPRLGSLARFPAKTAAPCPDRDAEANWIE